jgi:uncharacterized Fe-S cluster protein YjdI
MPKEPKEYSNGEITVVWQQEKCIHSAKCVRGLPGVFKPQERPWISVQNADTPHLKATIDTCPSGALTWKKVDAPANAEIDKAVAASAKLSIMANGPILIKGSFELTDSEGKTMEVKRKRCALPLWSFCQQAFL